MGVLGGTFDPVHYGHLHVANALRAALGLQKVIWVPAGRPPHKAGQIVSRDRDRLAMLELALADSPNDEISTVDLDRSGPSYTADTLELLSTAVAPGRLVFLMGEDSLRDLPAWHDPERILQLAELAVAARPGIDTDLDAIAASCLVSRAASTSCRPRSWRSRRPTSAGECAQASPSTASCRRRSQPTSVSTACTRRQTRRAGLK